MRYERDRMGDPKHQEKKLAGHLTRAERNDWAESIEEEMRRLSPWPISYDVNCTQGPCFTEFSYTEFLGGMYLRSQSIEVNTRQTELASKEETGFEFTAEHEQYCLKDKYDLQAIPEQYQNLKGLVLYPGDNAEAYVDEDRLQRLLYENPEVMIKLHPLCSRPFTEHAARRYGGNRLILPNNLSGYALLRQCETVYTTSVSEMSAAGALMGKKLVDLTKFIHQSSGNYYPISRVLYASDDPKSAVVRMMGCKSSGLIMPWHTDYTERIGLFFEQCIYLREKYKPLNSHIAYPKRNPNDEPR
jgi:hypothetical protein